MENKTKMETEKKARKQKEIYPCEVCGKDALGYDNFCMCDKCFARKDVQRALFTPR